jgi:hypothetical protein
MRLQLACDQLPVSEEVDARTMPETVGDSLNHTFGAIDEIDSRKPERVGIARDRSEGHQEQVGAMLALSTTPLERPMRSICGPA